MKSVIVTRRNQAARWTGLAHEAHQAVTPAVASLLVVATPLVTPLQNAWRTAPEPRPMADDFREDFAPVPQALTYTAASTMAAPVRYAGYTLDLDGNPPRLILELP